MKHESWEADRRAIDWLNQSENKRLNDILGLCLTIPFLFLPLIFGQLIVGGIVHEFLEKKLGWVAQPIAFLAAVGHLIGITWLWLLVIPYLP